MAGQEIENQEQQIYRALLLDIVCGNYQPGDMVSKIELREAYQADREPAQAVLRTLCEENVLYRAPEQGYRVTATADRELSDIQRFRCVLEAGFMNRFWNMITSEAVSDLEELQNKPDECDVFFHWEQNKRFHLRLMQCYDDPYATKLLSETLAVQTRSFVQNRWDLWHKARFSERPLIHEEIIEEIRDGKKMLACKLLEADIKTF